MDLFELEWIGLSDWKIGDWLRERVESWLRFVTWMTWGVGVSVPFSCQGIQEESVTGWDEGKGLEWFWVGLFEIFGILVLM